MSSGTQRHRVPRVLLGLLALLSLATVVALPAGAASHRDAPLTSQDPTADQNDLYAFVSSDGTQKVLNVIASYIPLEEPADGPNYFKFADDVRYDLYIENSAPVSSVSGVTTTTFTGRPDVAYQFRFHTKYQCGSTFLTIGVGAQCDANAGPIATVGDNHQNLIQNYTITQVNPKAGTPSVDLTSGQTLLVPPDNIGRATPLYNQGGNGDNVAQTGALTTGALDAYTQQSIHTLPNGIKVFAGQRADAFYADLGSTFDLLQLRGLKDPTPPVNTLKGFNVHVIAMQIPLSQLASPQCPNGQCVMGVYTASWRRAVTVRPSTLSPGQDPNAPCSTTIACNATRIRVTGVNASTITNPDEGIANSSTAFSIGPWQQVGRLANPLFNEVFVALKDKDRWNQSKPSDDAQFSSYALNPELAVLANAVLGTSAQTTGRTDLAGIFIPDLLKVDTSTAPVPLMAGDVGDPGPGAKCGTAFSTLSVFGKDTIYSPFQNTCVASGWPNGRRLPDDVVGIALYALLGPTTGAAALPNGTGLSGMAPVNNHVFPFSPTPNNGRNHQHASQ